MNLDDFLDSIDKDLSWRKKEISELFGACKEQDLEVLRKSMLLMLYSHWEGFIKNSSKTYLKYISESKLKLSELTINYHTIALKGLISSCYESHEKLTLANELKFMDKFSDSNTKSFTINKKVFMDKDKSLVNTHDNLSPSVFNNLCKIIGLPEKEAIKTKKNYLDEVFLGNRNAIGHGSKIELDNAHDFNLSIESVDKLKNIIISIMNRFQTDIQEYAEQELYLSKNSEIKSKYDVMSEQALINALK